MDKRRLMSQAVRCALMTSAAVTAMGYASAASAANSNTPARLGKVTVTGTRIKRSNIETAQPITRISRQQIQKSGYTSIAQLLGQLSSSGSFSNTADLYSNGTTQVNLRNLGSNRNLVLVNGKRWMQGLGGTTNLNTIPTSIIDHIEILQDGASAVYGSDAIAGVINIITVKNFNGAEGHAYYGIHNDHQTGRWDGQIKQYDFTVGGGNDRGNVVFNVTYRKSNPIWRRNRRISRTPVAGEPGYFGGNSATPSGRFRLFGPAVSGRTLGQTTCGTYDPSNPADTLCDLTLQNAPAEPSLQNFRNFKNTDLYNVEQNRQLKKPTKNVTAYVQGHYDLFDNVTFTANAAYVRGEARTQDVYQQVKVGLQSSKKANGKTISIAASNPYNPFGVDLVSNTTDPCVAAGSCIGLNVVNRRLREQQAPSGNDNNRDYFHVFAGFNGYVNLFNREIDWDVGFAQNRVQGLSVALGDYNTLHIKKALGPASQCTSPCVPLNLFSGSTLRDGGSISPAQLNYIGYEPHNVSQSNLRDWTANLSSDVYNLPAGPLGVAIGYERVDQYGYNHPDSVLVQGNDEESNSPALTGRVVRNAEYAELNIPLLADLPGVQSLSVDIANRWTQFKRSGGEVDQSNKESFIHNSSGRLNIRYQPISDLLLRASWSQGFRSPNINELFSGLSNPYVGFSDPCAGGAYGGYTGGPLPPNCPNGALDVQPNKRHNFTSGSNANLEPEKSVSRTFGFVYSPSQLSGLDINADYFKIELTNAIGSVGYQNIIDGCFYNSSFCNLISVAGNSINDVRNVNTNVGGLLTEGVDVGVHYKFPSTPVGDFDARINGTFLKTFDQTNVNLATSTGFATSHLAGVGVHPKRRFNGYLDWDYGNWSAQYHIEYIGEAVDQCTISIQGYCSLPNQTADYQGKPGVFGLGRNHLGATVYHDVRVNYTVRSIHTTFGLGVNNLFDKKMPITGSGSFDGSIYRLPSRLIYGDIRVKF